MSSVNAASTSSEVNYHEYLMDPANSIVSERKGGKGNRSTIVKTQDGTEWVRLDNKQVERFCGFLYLQEALKNIDEDRIKAAENKIAIHNHKVIYLSRYYGERRPKYFQIIKIISELHKVVGYTDTAKCANLREVGNTLYLFDTEKVSFKPNVGSEIDTYLGRHHEIYTILAQKLDREGHT